MQSKVLSLEYDECKASVYCIGGAFEFHLNR